MISKILNDLFIGFLVYAMNEVLTKLPSSKSSWRNLIQLFRLPKYIIILEGSYESLSHIFPKLLL